MDANSKTCPICGAGQLHVRVVQEESEYKGHKGFTPLHFSECDVCGSEQTNPQQARANKRAMIAFKKQVDGLLTGTEVRTLRERLGINQTQAAQIFGGGPVAFSKYESDDVAQSEAMDKLLRLAAAIPEAFAHLARNAGVPIAPGYAQADDWQPAEWQPLGSDQTTQTQRAHLRVVYTASPTPELERKYA